MKFDPAKAWPYPVLRPPDCGDDYPYAEFQVTIDCKRIEGGIAIELEAIFDLSDPDLLQLVQEGAAKYVILAKSPKTHFRRSFESTQPRITATFIGELSDRVEFSSFLICVQDRPGFRASGWHEDFEGLSFDVRPGFVLAEDKPKEYWIDTADESPIGAAFECVEASDAPKGRWVCNLEAHRVQIRMSKNDYRRFTASRSLSNNTPDGQYFMNGVYLPALIGVLKEADQNPDAYSEYRWFASLDNRLDDVGCSPIGSATGVDRAEDAQKVLDSPFAKMPLIANIEVGS